MSQRANQMNKVASVFDKVAHLVDVYESRIRDLEAELLEYREAQGDEYLAKVASQITDVFGHDEAQARQMASRVTQMPPDAANIFHDVLGKAAEAASNVHDLGGPPPSGVGGSRPGGSDPYKDFDAWLSQAAQEKQSRGW